MSNHRFLEAAVPENIKFPSRRHFFLPTPSIDINLIDIQFLIYPTTHRNILKDAFCVGTFYFLEQPKPNPAFVYHSKITDLQKKDLLTFPNKIIQTSNKQYNI